MPHTFQTISPIDNSVYVEREYADDNQVARALDAARRAQRSWRGTSIGERAAICSRFVEAMEKNASMIAGEITRQMGRPISHSPGEIRGLAERSRYMISIAEESLADVRPDQIEGFNRFIRREPLGVVLTIAPWNYPYLTAVNSIVPAIMAGNAVILKHSTQTPLCAERFAEGFQAAGLPDGVFQYLHLTNEATDRMISSADIDFVAFTGSVAVGRMVESSAGGRFIGVGLELGGKDPAYVRADANLDHAIENIVDGVYFNAGQSCCGIERVYIHADVYDRFVDGFVELARKYALGNPLEAATTLGPMVKASAADAVREQIRQAVARGARSLIDESEFPASHEGTPYLAPQVVVDVDHSMGVMSEENFGPVAGIMKVRSDEEAVTLMNDSRYGLTASIWTIDEEAAIGLGGEIETGTCFMNRCDYLDPALAWTGVKESGRGCTLSRIGYEHLTRPKSFHLRTTI
jgi:acyl-CoA reductase-like NAD-dependent aldehyde dehydrogenase